jgi:transposase
MNRETIILTQREHQRLHVLSRIHDGVLRAREAARLLGLSLRHLRRLLGRWRQHGPAAVVHGNRGRPSRRRVTETVRTRILALARTTYAGVNDHHLTELLAEREGLHVSRKTVQRLLRAAGIGSPRKRRPPRHRRRRERMPQAGLLVQMDGSDHPWLEDRGPRLVLLAAIDDATGEVLAGVFRPEEDTHGYFLLLRQLIRRYGLPVAAYTDRHGIFHRDPRTPQGLAEQLEGDVATTQVGRALQELGIRWIPAASPQGKGRVERLFGTFQDRLVVELRLALARTLSEAQRVFDRFRPRYNARFTHVPAQSEPAWRPAPADLTRICCFKYRRTVAHDNTVQLNRALLQVHPGPDGRSYAGTRVDVHAFLDGTLAIYHRGQRLSAKGLPPGHRPSRMPQERFSDGTPYPDIPLAGTGTQLPPEKPRPSADHPWRRAAAAGARRKQHQTQEGDIFINPLR